ncbi:hypothetical protein [Tuberibacillus sp. Marseille-P3662]|uniref:hypothetical protein n=1 Tax=Tuberibacillus sp. Marseille-P3662 TaxID=1965358 RepID=UPI000A1CC6D6|nr:hypothetical protein [Tuberibacillus sp. Marseille-P3662]
MNVYDHSYLKALKKNFMLVIMALVLLIPTFFIWAGVPFFIIGGIVENSTTNSLLVHLCMSFSGGLLFSLYFVPINFKTAKSIADITDNNVVKCLICIQSIFILVCSVIFEVIAISLFN